MLCVFHHFKQCFLMLRFQVIGTLPLLVNPASLAGGAATPTLPLQGLQLQTVTPQLLLNTQGQIIATVGNGPAAAVTSAAVIPKPTAPPTLSKPNSQVNKHINVTALTESGTFFAIPFIHVILNIFVPARPQPLQSLSLRLS